jgi:TolB protein
MNTISIFSTSRMNWQRRGKLVIDLALRGFALAAKHGARLRLIVFSLLLLAFAAGTQLASLDPVIGRGGAPSRYTMTKRMVFVSEIKGNYEVYIMREDGREWINLTHSPGDDMNPRLSPDATHIVFDTRRDGNAEIYSMRTDGTDLRNLTNNPEDDLMPAWSPDGLHIVFARGGGMTSELYTMNADGSAQAVLTHDGVSNGEPAWSPDGVWVAYESRLRGSMHIRKIKVATGFSVQLTNDPGMDFSPNWSPDSRRIAFSRRSATDGDIWIIDADGSRPTNITHSTTVNEEEPVWSRDGGKIAFVQNPIGAGLNIWMMNADGTALTQITRTGHDIEPDW